MRDLVNEINKLYKVQPDADSKAILAAALKGDANALQTVKGWPEKLTQYSDGIFSIYRFNYIETSESTPAEFKNFINLIDAIGMLKALANAYWFSEHIVNKIYEAFGEKEFIKLVPGLFPAPHEIEHNFMLNTVTYFKKNNPNVLKHIKARRGSLGFLAAALLDENDADLAGLLDETLKQFMAENNKADRAIFPGLIELNGKNTEANKVLIKYTVQNPDKVIGGLMDSLGQVKSKRFTDLYLTPDANHCYADNAVVLFNFIKEFCKNSGIKIEYYISYLFSYSIFENEEIDKLFILYGNDLELIKKAIPLMTHRGQLEAYAYLLMKGEQADFEKIDAYFIEMIHPSDRVKNWLLSGTGESPDKISGKDMDFCKVNLFSAGKILGFSDVAARYLNALMMREWKEEYRITSTINEVSVQYIVNMYLKYNKDATEHPWFTKVGLKSVLWNMEWYYNGENPNRNDVVYAIINRHPEVIKEAFTGTANQKIYLINHLTKDFDSEFLLSLLGDKSKKVADRAYKLLIQRKDLIPEFKKLTEAPKKNIREYAEKLLAELGGDVSNIVEAAVDKKATGEKSDARKKESVEKTIENYIENFDAKEYYHKYAKTIDKIIAWAKPEQWNEVRLAETEEVTDKDIIKYYIYQFINSKDINLPPNTKNIALTLEKSDLNKLSTHIYNVWLEEGSSTRQKGVLALFCVNASESDIRVLKKQIDYWAENSRTAIAAEALKSMLLSDTELAWMTVGNISKKYHYKSVKEAAANAIEYAAKTLGISPEEMVDRTTPSLGFDQHGEKEIDFGTRKFKALLTPELKIELSDETGKKLRSLPKPGKTDDETKADIAKKDLAALKKSLDEIVKNQSENLEKAIGSRRVWTQEGWRGLFEKNPIMHIFAEKLVWGFYNKGKLEASFIYSNDGSIVNNEYDNLNFEQYPKMHIGLVHPSELTQENLDNWREYLSDQDIHTQPVNQLDRPIFSKSDYNSNKIDVFGGKIVNALSFVSRLSKKGWYKNFYDHYSFKSMSKRSGSFEAVIQNNYLLMQVSYTDSSTIGWLRFLYNEEYAEISNIPDIFFSEVMYDLTVATEKAYDFDENWKKNDEE